MIRVRQMTYRSWDFFKFVAPDGYGYSLPALESFIKKVGFQNIKRIDCMQSLVNCSYLVVYDDGQPDPDAPAAAPAENSSTFCSHCGAAVPTGNFCTNCGKKL